MKRDEAIKRIDSLVSVLTVDIPAVLEIHGKKYFLKEDIVHGERKKLIEKYTEIYHMLREEISEMEDVPEALVEKTLILRRLLLFLKEYRETDRREDAERWLEFIKKIEI